MTQQCACHSHFLHQNQICFFNSWSCHSKKQPCKEGSQLPPLKYSRQDVTQIESYSEIYCFITQGSNNIALGYDDGSLIIKLGREEPAMSMDNNGKIIWARHSEIQQANLKAMAGKASMYFLKNFNQYDRPKFKYVSK